jgi:hypothetical protein
MFVNRLRNGGFQPRIGAAYALISAAGSRRYDFMTKDYNL